MEQKSFSEYTNKQMFRTYRAPVRYSDVDAEPRFDGVDRSFPLAEASSTR
jgi:hypothetical protein